MNKVIDKDVRGDWVYWDEKWKDKIQLSDCAANKIYYTEKTPIGYQQVRLRAMGNTVVDNVVNYKALEPKFSCLEVACGRGTLSLIMKRKLKSNTTLLDKSPWGLRLASHIFRLYGENCTVVMGDAEHISFKDSSFDCVMTFGLLEHFEDPSLPLYEMIKVLKPGGLFITLNVPETRSIQHYLRPINYLFAAPSVLKRKIRMYLNREVSPQQKTAGIYKNNYPAKYYVEIAEKAGLRGIKCFHINSIPLLSHAPKIVNDILIYVWYLFYLAFYSMGKDVFVTGQKLSREHVIMGVKA